MERRCKNGTEIRDFEAEFMPFFYLKMIPHYVLSGYLMRGFIFAFCNMLIFINLRVK